VRAVSIRLGTALFSGTSDLDVLTTRSSRRLAWAAIIAFFLAIYLGSAFSPALQDDVDTSHAEAAREMLTRGDFVTLHINGVRYLEKAPLMYWLVAGCFRVLGVNELAARLPTVTAMFGIVLLAIVWGRRAFGERAGLYAGLFTTTGLGYFLFTRVMIPEAIVSVLIVAAFYCVISALDKPQAVWEWYAVYGLMGLAVLAKGLMGLVVIGLTVLPYLASSREWRRWREFRLGTGLLVFLAIAAPWHILAGLRNPGTAQHHGFFWFYFINEHVLRFLGKRIPKDYNKLPASLYWSLHLVWLFPWSLYLPLAFRRVWREVRRDNTVRVLSANASAGALRAGSSPSFASAVVNANFNFATRTRLICILWASVTLVFFALSTNQEYYTFPAYFPFFLLLAAAVAGEEEDNAANRVRRKWLVTTSAVSVGIRLIFAAVLIFGLWSSRHLPFVPDIGEVLAETNLNTDTLSMGHILNLTDESFAALRLPAILAVVALVFGSISEMVLRIRRKDFAATWALAATMTVFLIAAHIALVRFDPFLSSRVLVDRIEQQLKPQDRVLIYGDQAYGSSLVFYLHHPVELVNGRTTSMWFGSTWPDAPHIFLDNADLLRLWDSPTRVFLYAPSFQRKKVEALLGSRALVYAESSGKVVYTNHN
jgi:4-amino-4-deoxy-L-arabinose transferase-like glycosyltransferase